MYTCSIERMTDKIKTFSKFGDAGHGGITRYTLSPEDIQARNEFKKRMEAIGAMKTIGLFKDSTGGSIASPSTVDPNNTTYGSGLLRSRPARSSAKRCKVVFPDQQVQSRAHSIHIQRPTHPESRAPEQGVPDRVVPNRVPVHPADSVKTRVKALPGPAQGQDNDIVGQNSVPRTIEIGH